MVRAAAASICACGTITSNRPRSSAAVMMPASLPFSAGVAISEMSHSFTS